MKMFFAELLTDNSDAAMHKHSLFYENIVTKNGSLENKNTWVHLDSEVFQRIKRAEHVKNHAFPDSMAAAADTEDNSYVHSSTSQFDVYVNKIYLHFIQKFGTSFNRRFRGGCSSKIEFLLQELPAE